MTSSSNDPREYLDDLLDQVGEQAILELTAQIEAELRAKGSPYKLRDKPAAPTELKVEQPDRYLNVTLQVDMPGLGRKGDNLFCTLKETVGLRIPKNTKAAERDGWIGEWLVFTSKKHSIAKVMFPTAFGSKEISGKGWYEFGRKYSEGVCLDRVHIDLVYTVEEVHPATARPWRTDREFVAAIEKAGIPAALV